MGTLYFNAPGLEPTLFHPHKHKEALESFSDFAAISSPADELCLPPDSGSSPCSSESQNMIKRIPGTWGYFGTDEDNHLAPSPAAEPVESKAPLCNVRVIQKGKSNFDTPMAYDPKQAKESVARPKPTAQSSTKKAVIERDVSKAARRRAFQAQQKQQKKDRQHNFFKANAGLKDVSKAKPRHVLPNPAVLNPVPAKPSMSKAGRPQNDPTKIMLTPAARATPAPARPTDQPFRLMDLPAELRLSIFQHVFDGAFVIMDDIQLFGKYPQSLFPCMSPHSRGIPFRTFPSLMRSPLMKWEPNSILHDRRIPIMKPSDRGSKHNTGLLFVSKQIAREVAPLLYEKSVFAFGRRKHIANFLEMHKTSQQVLTTVLGAKIARRIRSERMEQSQPNPVRLPTFPIIADLTLSMKHLCLEIRAYGEPCLLKHRPAYIQYYDSWRITCRQMAEKLPNLTDVAISAHVPWALDGRPCSLAVDARWAIPLLEFANCRNLETAAITLMLPLNGPGLALEIGQAFSEVLRRLILGWDTPSAFEALREWKLREGTTGYQGTRRATKEEWALVELANGLDPIEPDDEDVEGA